MKFIGLKKAFLSLMVMGFVTSAIAESTIKIGYVDMQKAIHSTSAGKKAKKRLERAFNKKKEKLKKKEKDIHQMREDLNKKQALLSEEVKQRKADELRVEMMKYQEMVGKSQLELREKELEYTKPIVEKLQSSIEKIAKEEGFTVILGKLEQSVLFAKKEIDLTDRLIESFEKGK